MESEMPVAKMKRVCAARNRLPTHVNLGRGRRVFAGYEAIRADLCYRVLRAIRIAVLMLSAADIACLQRASDGDFVRAADNRAAVWEYGENVVVHIQAKEEFVLLQAADAC
jgi:hypothetical protein